VKQEIFAHLGDRVQRRAHADPKRPRVEQPPDRFPVGGVDLRVRMQRLQRRLPVDADLFCFERVGQQRGPDADRTNVA
jgi:hypothetical protein